MKDRYEPYCSDCGGKPTQWKIVDADSHDSQMYKINRRPCDKILEKKDKKDCKKEKKYKCKKIITCCRGEKGEKGDRGDSGNVFAATIISVKNPQTDLVIPELLETSNLNIAPLQIIGNDVDLAQWTDIVIDALNSFDNVTGTFTAPETGDYVVNLVVNYETSVSIPVSPSLTDVPIVQVYDVLTGNKILASSLPSLNIIVPIPPLSSGELPINVDVSTIIAKSQVIINAVIPLVVGQRIRVRALTNGLVYAPPVSLVPPGPAVIDFSPEGLDTTLTIYKIRNTPLININVI